MSSNHKNRSHLFWIFVCAASFALASPALAQTATADKPPAAAAKKKDTQKIDPIFFESGHWRVDITGFLRVAYLHVNQPEESGLNFIGENNGFALLDARLGFRLAWAEMLAVVIQLDGTSDERDSVNDTSGQLRFRLRDAFTEYSPGPWLRVRAGLARPPLNAETLISAGAMPFVRRSVATDGVRSGEGVRRFGTEGFGRTRELGLHVLSDPIWLGASPVGLSYALALTNGNDAFNSRNDNNAPAYYGRLQLHLSQSILGEDPSESFVTLGGVVGYNENSPVQFPRPDLINQEDFLWAVDLRVSGFGFDVLGALLSRSRSFPDIGQETQDTLGVVGHLAYRLPVKFVGLQFAYRFALLDPFAEGARNDEILGLDDQLIYHTIGLAYDLPGVPAEVKLNYTLTTEEGDSAIDNDLIEVLVQAVW